MANGNAASDFSSLPNPFLATTSLMQDPTAAPQQGVLEKPQVTGFVVDQSAAAAQQADPNDPAALRQQAQAEAEKASQGEAAAIGAQAKALTGAAGQLETDVNADVKAATDVMQRSVTSLNEQQARRDQLAENQAKLEEQKAAALQTDEQKLDNYVQNTPTRQAAAAAAMHLSGPLAILTALGGALTRQSGLAMMGALNGVVQGVQEGAENKYNDAMDQWQKGLDQLKHHQETTREVYSAYLEAYKDRVDAVDKAVEHTNAVMGIQVQAEQMKIGGAKDIFHAKDQAYDAVMKYGVALAKIHEARAARMEANATYNQGVIDLKAGQLLDGVPSTQVFAGMRGIKGLPFQNSVWSRAEELWYQRPENANNPAYVGHPEVMAQDAAKWLDNAQRQAKAGERAMQASQTAAGKIEFADKLLVQSLPLAQQDMQTFQRKWPNKSFVPYNQMTARAKEVMGNPELRQLQISIRQVLADYNALNTRTGMGSMTERIENENLLKTADSPQAFYSALNRMLTETAAVRKAAELSRDPRSYGLGLSTTSGAAPLASQENILGGEGGGAPKVSNWSGGGSSGGGSSSSSNW